MLPFEQRSADEYHELFKGWVAVSEYEIGEFREVEPRFQVTVEFENRQFRLRGNATEMVLEGKQPPNTFLWEWHAVAAGVSHGYSIIAWIKTHAPQREKRRWVVTLCRK